MVVDNFNYILNLEKKGVENYKKAHLIRQALITIYFHLTDRHKAGIGSKIHQPLS